MRKLVRKLEKKGWNKKDISKTVGIIKKAKLGKTAGNLFLQKRVYWTLLLVVVVVNFALSAAIVPLLVALSGVFLYFVIMVAGLAFGLLLELAIRSIEHLEKKHHLALAFFIPLVAAISAFIMSNLSNNVAESLKLDNINSPYMIAATYAFALILPYAICRYVLKKGYYSAE